MSAKPRALVTDGEGRSSLAACRGLHVGGYHVTAVASTRRAVAHWSRCCHERLRLCDPAREPRAYVEQLAGELERAGYDVLLPGSEASLLPISEHRELIEPHVRLGLPPHEVLLRSLDKLLLPVEAAAFGLAPPPTFCCSSSEEARTAARALGFPVVVKPARSFTPAGDGLRQHPARIVGDEGELGQAGELGATVSIQRFVPTARIVSVAGVRAGGQLLGLTVARYARTWPPRAGSASMAMTVPAPPGLVERVDHLLERIGWTGIFELELLDLGGGRYGAIDLNPRVFGWLALCLGAGANLPALWCDHLLGREPAATTAEARVGVRYRWNDADARHLLWQLRRGHVSAALAVLRPHRHVAHPHFRLDDPLPAAARAIELCVLADRKRRKRSEGAAAGLVAPAQSRKEDHVPDRVPAG